MAMSDYAIFHNLARLHQYPYVLFVAHFYNWSDNSINTLRMLNTQGSLTAGQISEQLDIKPSSVTQIINKLEQVHAIKREKSSEDSRVTQYFTRTFNRECITRIDARSCTFHLG